MEVSIVSVSLAGRDVTDWLWLDSSPAAAAGGQPDGQPGPAAAATNNYADIAVQYSLQDTLTAAFYL